MGGRGSKHIYHNDPRVGQLTEQVSNLTQQLQKNEQERQQLLQSVLGLQKQGEAYQKSIEELSKQLQVNKQIIEQKVKEIESLNDIRISEQIRYGIISSDLLKSFGADPQLLERLGFLSSKLNIAFIGRVSAGKSTIVNILLGEKRAAVGVNETTKLPPLFYASAKFPNLALWDFAGVGGVKSDYANPENRQYIFLLSKMDVICVVHDGVFDASTRQTFNFVKEFPNKKVLLLNKVDQIVQNMIDDDHVAESAEALRFLDAEGYALSNFCNADDHFLISARNTNLNQQKQQHKIEYDWNAYISSLAQLEIDKNNDNNNKNNNKN